ncbi:unnamed protein product [Medioppia subpectinata]|uniref:Uncharacterized protein n=1 Tax=Medioppia subpectinata TaxID=1979941 RepID=A0A7R9PXE1_9ACAR|nr:unnamed protein product [Medioppia subpectinata]CAG2103901.1 unnamed protein product [Medioppia subpectinata]
MFFKSLGAKARYVSLNLNGAPDRFAKLQAFCRATDPVALGRAINSKLTEAKRIRENAVGTIIELTKGNDNMPDLLCAIKAYTDQMVNLYGQVDDNTRTFVSQIMSLYNDMADSAAKLSVKASTGCDIENGHKLEGAQKYKSFLFPVFKAFNKFLKYTPDVTMDIAYERVIMIGTGRPYPDTDEALEQYCNEHYYQFSVEVSSGTLFYNSLNPSTRSVTSILYKMGNYCKLLAFCQLSEPIQVAKSLNSKLDEAKKLFDSAIGYMANVINTTEALSQSDEPTQVYVRNVMSVLREMADVAENMTSKAVDTCDFSEGLKYKSEHKYLSPLLPFFMTVDKTFNEKYVSESAEQSFDRMLDNFMGIGNGRLFPATDEGTKYYCNQPYSKFWPRDLQLADKFFRSFGNNKTYDLITAFTRPNIYILFNWFCSSPDPTKLGKTINAKSVVIKNLRNNVISNMVNLDTRSDSIADVICYIRLYATKLVDVFEGDQLSHDNAIRVTQLYQEFATLIETMTMVKGTTNCQLKDLSKMGSDYHKYKTFLVPAVKTVDRFINGNTNADITSVSDSSNSLIIDEVVDNVFWAATFHKYPETDAEIAQSCKHSIIPEQKVSSMLFEFMNTLNVKTRQIAAQFYASEPELKGLYCQHSAPLSVSKAMNDKLEARHTLVDNALGSLLKLNDQATATMADVLCIINSYGTQFAAIYDAKDPIVGPYISQLVARLLKLIKTVELLSTKPADTCDISDGHKYLPENSKLSLLTQLLRCDLKDSTKYQSQNKYLTLLLPVLKAFNVFV